MVISKVEFNKAMDQINEAFRGCWERLDKLEELVEASNKKTTRAKAPAKAEEEDAA